MATLVTKFSVGDSVFCASTVTIKKKHSCPDCNGERKWKAVSPAGAEYTFSCPRCSANYQSNDILNLEYTIFTGSVSRLTIGSIQYNTELGSHDHGARYMCRETGVGSGRVYPESDLFATEDEAKVAADAKASAQNLTTPWVAKQYDKTLAVKDYELGNALISNAETIRSRATSLIWNLGDLFGRIEEAADKNEILEAINEYRENDWEKDKQNSAEQASEPRS